MEKKVFVSFIICLTLFCGCVGTTRTDEYYNSSIGTVEELKKYIGELQAERDRLVEENRKYAEDNLRISESMGRTISELQEENRRLTEQNQRIGRELQQAINEFVNGVTSNQGDLDSAIDGIDKAIRLLEELQQLTGEASEKS